MAAAAAALLAAGCSNAGSNGATAAQSASAGEPCRADADCSTGFCDRERCASPQPDQSYGRACQPGLSPAESPTDAKVYVCGAYVCHDARCRSCVSDQECQTQLGAPRCATVEGRPGHRCGAGDD